MQKNMNGKTEEISSTVKQEDATKNTILELYKLEYQTGVKRHDDIYKSLWTNFSYMAILAGGILTFGKGLLPLEFIGAIACVPLLFWFWSSFLPLDRYGNQISKTISELEKAVNFIFFKDFENKSLPESSNYNENEIRFGLFLYTDFENRKRISESKATKKNDTKNSPQEQNSNPQVSQAKEEQKSLWENIRSEIRVKHSVVPCFAILHLIFFGLLVLGFYNMGKSKINKQNETVEEKLESINTTLKEISNK